MGRKGSSQFARPKRSSRRGQHLGPTEPSEDLLPVCPRLALCASLLLEPGLDPFPFRGTFPDLYVEQSVLMDVLTCIAVHVLPTPMLQDYRAGARGRAGAGTLFLTHGKLDGCMKARTGSRRQPYVANARYGQPSFMLGATWQCLEGRWSFKLRPASSARKDTQLIESIVARFQGDDESSMEERASGIRHFFKDAPQKPLHSVTRVLCWFKNGPPPRDPGTSATKMLHGTEGWNNACHDGCPIETPLCLSQHHVHWGTAALNAKQREQSRKTRVRLALAKFQNERRT